MMEFSQIRYFLEAAQSQHITKSAERLHIAQPALSKSIHNLEKELGVPLFMRQGRNIVLTQYGQYLKDKLLPLMNAIDNVPAELAHMSETENHTIRLSVLAASTIVTKAIIEYKRQFPKVNFHVLQNPESELFDLEITTSTFDRQAQASDHMFVCAERIFLAVPDTDRYRGINSIKLADVKDEGFISLFGSKQLRNICDGFCRNAGFEPNIIFESDSPDAVKNMIGANIGIGFWPEFTWGSTNDKSVRLLEIESPVCKRNITITYKKVKADCTHTESFYEFLKAYFTDKK